MALCTSDGWILRFCAISIDRLLNERMEIQYNDLPQIRESHDTCQGLNIKADLNNPDILEKLYSDILNQSGIGPSQTVSIPLFSYKGGIIIRQYASGGILNSSKVLTLISQVGEMKATEMLGLAAISLMEQWGILEGGPKCP